MLRMNKPQSLVFAALLAMAAPLPALSDAKLAAEQALTEILFDLSIDDATYVVHDDGHIEVDLGPGVSDQQFENAMARMAANKAINSVLQGGFSNLSCRRR
jgi:hypothetical protein